MADLKVLVDEVKTHGGKLPVDELQVCVRLVSRLVWMRYIEGRRGALVAWTDDNVVSPAAARYLNLPASMWQNAVSWERLIEQVPPGGVTVVAYGRTGQPGHAVALVDTDSGVYVIDPRGRDEVDFYPAVTDAVTMLPELSDVLSGNPRVVVPRLLDARLLNARTLTIGADGRPLAPDEPNIPISYALTDPTDPRIGAPAQGVSGSAVRGRPVPADRLGLNSRLTADSIGTDPYRAGGSFDLSSAFGRLEVGPSSWRPAPSVYTKETQNSRHAIRIVESLRARYGRSFEPGQSENFGGGQTESLIDAVNSAARFAEALENREIEPFTAAKAWSRAFLEFNFISVAKPVRNRDEIISQLLWEGRESDGIVHGIVFELSRTRERRVFNAVYDKGIGATGAVVFLDTKSGGLASVPVDSTYRFMLTSRTVNASRPDDIEIEFGTGSTRLPSTSRNRLAVISSKATEVAAAANRWRAEYGIPLVITLTGSGDGGSNEDDAFRVGERRAEYIAEIMRNEISKYYQRPEISSWRQGSIDDIRIDIVSTGLSGVVFQEDVELPFLQRVHINTYPDFRSVLDELYSPSTIPEVPREPIRLTQVLPWTDVWRFFIDPLDHYDAIAASRSDPGLLYDKQKSPGFKRSMIKAYETLVKNGLSISNLDWNLYRTLHAIVSEGMPGIQGRLSGRPSDITFGLGMPGPARDALTEKILGRPLMADARMLKDPAVRKARPLSTIVSRDSENRMIVRITYRSIEAQGLVNAIFNDFRADLNVARSEHEKLRAIARVIRNLHIVHVFIDANGRLNVYLLLVFLLMQLGFTPMIYGGPDLPWAITEELSVLFNGGYSLDQIATALRLGQGLISQPRRQITASAAPSSSGRRSSGYGGSSSTYGGGYRTSNNHWDGAWRVNQQAGGALPPTTSSGRGGQGGYWNNPFVGMAVTPASPEVTELSKTSLDDAIKDRENQIRLLEEEIKTLTTNPTNPPGPAADLEKLRDSLEEHRRLLRRLLETRRTWDPPGPASHGQSSAGAPVSFPQGLIDAADDAVGLPAPTGEDDIEAGREAAEARITRAREFSRTDETSEGPTGSDGTTPTDAQGRPTGATDDRSSPARMPGVTPMRLGVGSSGGGRRSLPQPPSVGPNTVLKIDGAIIGHPAAPAASSRTPVSADAVASEPGLSREQLNFRYGPAVDPLIVRGQERGKSGELRLNPLWYRLADFPRRLLVEHPEVTWLYVVDEDGQIRIGVEHIRSVVSEYEWQQLTEGLSSVGQSSGRMQDRMGHPTIAAVFTEDGRTIPGRARISGELRWNAKANGDRGRWEVNDDSGRYMSKWVRPNRDPKDVMRWISSVADDLAEHLSLDFTPNPITVSALKSPIFWFGQKWLPWSGAGGLDGEIIDEWRMISRLLFQQTPTRQRSLKEIDSAFRRWKKGGRRSPRNLERNARELRDVLKAIDQWKVEGDPSAPVNTAIIRLHQRIQEELADVNNRLIPPVKGKPMAVASHPAEDDDNAIRGAIDSEATQRMVPAARDLQVALWLLSNDPGKARNEAQAELAALREGINRLGPDSAPRLRQEALQHQVDRIEGDLQIFNSMHARSPQVWRRLREAQTAALVVVERRGRQVADRDYATSRNRFNQAAWARGYSGMDTDALLRTVHDHLRSGMQLTTNMPRQGIDSLLADPEGRFRNYWENGTTGGTDDRARRVKIEEVFGHAATLGRSRGLTGPESHEQGDLPKYAALISRLRPSGLRNYGDVVLVWKQEVTARTTFTPQGGFSWTDLHAAQGAPLVTGPDHLYPLLAYGADDVVRLAFAEATDFVYDPELRAELTAGAATDGFIEAQIHGDLYLSDLDEIVITYHEGWYHHAEQDRARLLAYAHENNLDLRVELSRIGDPASFSEPYLARDLTRPVTDRAGQGHDVPVSPAFTRAPGEGQPDQAILNPRLSTDALPHAQSTDMPSGLQQNSHSAGTPSISAGGPHIPKRLP